MAFVILGRCLAIGTAQRNVSRLPRANHGLPCLAHPSVVGFDADWSRRSLMAKSQKRSSREQKKPKQEKPKPMGGQSAFAGLHERPAVPTATKKK